MFFVKISIDAEENAVVGPRAITQVTILNDDRKFNYLYIYRKTSLVRPSLD